MMFDFGVDAVKQHACAKSQDIGLRSFNLLDRSQTCTVVSSRYFENAPCSLRLGEVHACKLLRRVDAADACVDAATPGRCTRRLSLPLQPRQCNIGIASSRRRSCLSSLSDSLELGLRHPAWLSASDAPEGAGAACMDGHQLSQFACRVPALLTVKAQRDLCPRPADVPSS